MKPISILLDEAKIQIANIINNSELPSCVIEMMLQGFLIEIQPLVKQELENDRIKQVLETQKELEEKAKEETKEENAND